MAIAHGRLVALPTEKEVAWLEGDRPLEVPRQARMVAPSLRRACRIVRELPERRHDEAFRTRRAHHGLKKAQAVLETGRMMHEAEADRQVVCIFA